MSARSGDPAGGLPEFTSYEDVWRYLRQARNWGRWGDDDQLGALNLITAEKRRRTAALVRTGEIVSLSRPFPLERAPNNPTPAERRTKSLVKGSSSVSRWGRATSGPTPATTAASASGVTSTSGRWPAARSR